MKKIFLALSLLLMTLGATAQQDLTLYNMNSIGQSVRVNPSLMPFNKDYVGLPGISSVYFLFTHGGFMYHDFYKRRSDDSVKIDVDNAISKLSRRNLMQMDLQIDLLSFGFTVKKNYFTANITEHATFGFAYAKELFQLLTEGNGPFVGKQLNFSKTGFDASHYREYAIGYARTIDEKWTAGIRLKYLYGMENFSSSNNNLGFSTASDDYHLTVPTEIVINSSTMANSDAGYDQLDSGSTSQNATSIRNYLFKRKNRGFGVDLGANYKFNEKWTFSGSLTDLGWITWKSDVKNYRTKAGQYEFGGVDLKHFINDSTADMQGILDSLGNSFKAQETADSYKTYLHAHAYLGANYHLDEKSFAGALVHAQFFKKTIQPTVTLSYNRQVGRHLAFGVTYSYINHHFDNIGAGISMNAGPLQLYAASDNLLGTFMPLDYSTAHIHVGLNLVFGRPQRDRDKDKVPDKQDACPTIPGLVELHGCPDRDGDGVADKDDRCPDVPGLKKFNGCPDWDNDGIVDSLDKCPDIPGLAIFEGCPDTDGDSIPDPSDSCITVKGLAQFHGCPDSDNDGIEDAKDSCIFVAGPASNNGCPIVVKAEVKPAEPVKAQLTREEQEVINKVFRNLEFETAKAVIRPGSYGALDELTALLKKKPSFRLLIEGHTDNVGAASYNLKLSQSRADAVKKYLTDKQIDGTRIISKGYGMTKPVASNKTAEGRQRNRRVEFTILE